MRQTLLLRVVRTIIRADSDPARQALFARLLQSRPTVRLAFRLHERLRGTRRSALLVACFGLASFMSIAPPRRSGVRLLAAARHENARRQVARVFGWMGPEECAEIRSGIKAMSGWSAVRALGALIRGGQAARAIRIIRRIDARYGFLVSCRAASGMAWYARSRTILGAIKPGAVLVSSDSNPEEVGFLGAARALGIPQVFISHAYPTPLSPQLDFDLSILEGEAAIQARRRKGPIKGEVLLAGIEGESAPLDPRRFRKANPVIGIFTSKAISWTTFAAVIDDCRSHFAAERILIRWHPSMLERRQLTRLLGDCSGIVETPRTAELTEVAQQCDWVIADENSNVHLQVLKLGVPTVAVKNLGIYPESRSDQYGFVARGVIFPPIPSVRDLPAEALIEFFSTGWQARFEHYDAAYFRSGAEVGAEVRRAISALFEHSPTKTNAA
jgi:hypothetical protein